MKSGDGVVEFSAAPRAGEIGEREAFKRFGENLAIGHWIFQQLEENVDWIAASGGNEIAGILGEQARKTVAREALGIRVVVQGAGEKRQRRQCAIGANIREFRGELGHHLLDQETSERNV